MTSIEGFVPAIVTPFNERGDIQWDSFAAIVHAFIENGANGICIAGDNGESWTLSIDERCALLVAARKAANGRVPLILGASAPTTKQAIKYAEAAAAEGADA